MKHHIAGAAALALILAAPGIAQTAPKPNNNVRATIDSGVLVGETANGVNYFRGVPFAKPPVGELRWRAPQKVEKWSGERYAVAFEPACTQRVNIDQKTANGGGVVGPTSEDCLYLNVFAPAGAKNAPIMVWFYGGGSTVGAAHLGSFDGTSNAKQGVITVALNYRLGPLGQFSHPAISKDSKAHNEGTGSWALMDGVAALEWVKRNAAAFGGDPNNVTIAGQSAGGFMVSTLLSVPSAKGLFHKAVVESGAGIGPAGTLEAAEKKGAEIATKLGFDGAKATAKQLRSVSAQTIVYNPETTGVHGAPIDGKFRTQSTADAFAKGTDNDVPVLVGSNSGEGGFNGARNMAKLAGEKGAAAWLYQFAYTPSFRSEWKQGPIHSGELMFAFDSVATSSWASTPNGKANDADKQVAKLVNSCWVAFYKMDPKAKSFTCADGFTWPAYTDADDNAAQFGATPKLVKSKTLPNGPASN